MTIYERHLWLVSTGEAGWGRQDRGEAQHQPHRGPHQAGDHGQVRNTKKSCPLNSQWLLLQRPGADKAGVQYSEPGSPEQSAGGQRDYRAGEPHRVRGDPAAAVSQG